MTFSRSVRNELADVRRAPAADIHHAVALMTAFSAFAGHVECDGPDFRLLIRVSERRLVRLLDRAANTLDLQTLSRKSGARDTHLIYRVPRSRRNILFFDMEYWTREGAEDVLSSFLSGAFMACGVVSDPASGRYRLVFSPPGETGAQLIFRLLSYAGLVPGRLSHQGKTAVCLTSGDDVAEFLRLCGAGNALIRYEELRSERELSGQVHRQLNFDDANLSRRVRSIERQLGAIGAIARLRGLDSLSPQLQEAAEARLANQGASLEELGVMMNPPVSKSGMGHRLNKLCAIGELLREN